MRTVCGARASISAVSSATFGRSTRVVASESEHLAGDVRFRASSAIDGDPTTAWNTPFVAPTGQWMEFTSPTPVTVDRLDLQVVADGRHSVPTQVTLSVDGTNVPLAVPPITDANYRSVVASLVGDANADAVVARYPTSMFGGDARFAAGRALGDAGLACPTRATAIALRDAGVPVHTYMKWETGQRAPNASALRLFDVLALIEAHAPALHAQLLEESEE